MKSRQEEGKNPSSTWIKVPWIRTASVQMIKPSRSAPFLASTFAVSRSTVDHSLHTIVVAWLGTDPHDTSQPVAVGLAQGEWWGAGGRVNGRRNLSRSSNLPLRF